MDLVSAYIRRIREVQPIINAVVEERFEEALKDAEEVDRLVCDRMRDLYSGRDGVPRKMPRAWRCLGQAGAIPLALTNVPEMCMWGDSQNLVDGCTRNPHDTRRSPGGSSGGEGSLLAASGSLIGLGTDIGGSVRIPAAFCGIFGHKPTAGVVPNTGLLPDVGENLTQFNCVGPMTRFAEDLPLILNVLAGSATTSFRLNEKREAFTSAGRQMDARRAVRQVVQYLNKAHGIEGHPLQLPELRFGTFEWFKVAGVKEPKPLSEVFRPGGFNVLVELLRHLVGAGRHTLAALVACTIAPLCHFRSKQKGEAYVISLENVRDRFEETLGDNGVLVLPAATSAALFQNQDLMFFDSAGMTSFFSLFKVPATVCPVMRSEDNLPMCVQVVAKRGNDRLCLAVAREIEKHFGGWIDPSAKFEGKA
ncbi:hypothetical protein MTO96_026770 [Rhipicephalus appendiculatus]